MQPRIGPFTNGMRPVRVSHHGKDFVVLDKLVDQVLEALVVDVIIAGTMRDQKVAFQVFSKRDGGTVRVACLVVIRQSHKSLLIDRIIKPLIADKSDGHASVISSG